MCVQYHLIHQVLVEIPTRVCVCVKEEEEGGGGGGRRRKERGKWGKISNSITFTS